MTTETSQTNDVDQLHTALSNMVKMYQFRHRNEHLSYAVTVSEAYCLRALWKGGRLSMSALADDQAVRMSTMTSVVDQLVKKGMVRRVSDPTDRRRQLVELTRKGTRKYGEANDKFEAALERAMAGCSARERKTIIDFLVRVRDVISEWRQSDG